MNPIIYLLLILVSMTPLSPVLAEQEALTLGGKRVLLKDDGTWSYLEDPAADSRYARLEVETLQGGNNYCRLGLRLTNDLADKITSIIFMFSAYVDQEVRYETVTKGFQHLRPTNDLYNEITFNGISCDEIEYVRVHGADRCEIGELNKFTAAKGQCLKLVEVAPSERIAIFKRYEDEAPQAMPEPTQAQPASHEETLEERWARELELNRQSDSGLE